MTQILNDYYSFQLLMAVLDMIKVFGTIWLVFYFVIELVNTICKELKHYADNQ